MMLKNKRLVIIGEISGIGLATAQTVLFLLTNTFTTGATLYVEAGHMLS